MPRIRYSKYIDGGYTYWRMRYGDKQAGLCVTETELEGLHMRSHIAWTLKQIRKELRELAIGLTVTNHNA